MGRRRGRRGIGGARRSAPIIATLEQTAVATADTVVNATLYAPPLSTTSVLQSWVFDLHSLQCVVTDGATACRTFACVRRVPAGYTSPSMTVSSSVTTFADVDNILCYGIYTTVDVREEIHFRWLRRRIRLYPGDSIVIQFVIDVSSASHAVSTLAEYNVSS